MVIFLLLFFLFPTICSANFSGGINIGDHYAEFDQAAQLAASGGWVYVMMQPPDAAKLNDWLTRYPNLNIIVRGHYPQVALTAEYASAWANNLVSLTRSIYFMPVNEPNNPVENVSAQTVVNYINQLQGQLQSKGLLGSKVHLLSPAIDVYTLSDQGPSYIQALGSWSFFSQFEGIGLNLYGEYNGGSLNTSAPPIKIGQGYREFLQAYFGAPADQAAQAKIYVLETGVKKVGENVKYAENANEIINYMNIVQPIWGSDSNLIMHAIFSYDPSGNKSPWIYTAPAVLSALGLTGTAGPPGSTAAPKPPGNPQMIFVPEMFMTKIFKKYNQKVLPKTVQDNYEAKNQDCSGFKFLGICFGTYKADIAKETERFQPPDVSTAKVVDEKSCGNIFSCAIQSLTEIINTVFNVVIPKQIYVKDTGSIRTFWPGAIADKNLQVGEYSSTLAQANASGSAVLGVSEDTFNNLQNTQYKTIELLLPPSVWKNIEPTIRPVRQPQYDKICSSDPCASCILNQRVDILSFYQNNGWDISCSNQKNIVDDWCSNHVDPAGCNFVRNNACKPQCLGGPEPVPTATPGGSLPPLPANCDLGTGVCSVSELSKKDSNGVPVYFPDERSARIASYICQRESRSDPNVQPNLGCTTGKSVDYSYGLFQFNLLAWCKDAFTYTWNPPSCQPINQANIDECVRNFSDPIYNIKFAVSASNNGTSWGPWNSPGDTCMEFLLQH